MNKRAVFVILASLIASSAVAMSVYAISDIKNNENETDISSRITEITEKTTNVITENTCVDTNPARISESDEQDATKFQNRPFIESEWTEVNATYYCPCVKCCGKWAIGRPLHEDGTEIVYGYYGTELKDGISIASNNFPEGTVIEIYGIGTRIVQDKGLCHDGIDIYCTDHDEALNHGIEKLYIREITK